MLAPKMCAKLNQTNKKIIKGRCRNEGYTDDGAIISEQRPETSSEMAPTMAVPGLRGPMYLVYYTFRLCDGQDQANNQMMESNVPEYYSNKI